VLYLDGDDGYSNASVQSYQHITELLSQREVSDSVPMTTKVIPVLVPDRASISRSFQVDWM
jgi:hypothetical protein